VNELESFMYSREQGRITAIQMFSRCCLHAPAVAVGGAVHGDLLDYNRPCIGQYFSCAIL
jgi:hypothetical protein